MADQALEPVDACVIGAGPAGLVTGLCAAHMGLTVAVIGPRADPNDGRTAALFHNSIELLKNTGVWDLIQPFAEPLSAIRLVDATDSLVRAPEVTFSAAEIGLDAFGYNVPNAVLTSTLESALSERVCRGAGTIRSISSGDRKTVVMESGDEIVARLIAAADGRNSLARQCASINVRTWTYSQAAVVTTFEHSRGHENISTEFHRRAGPLTVVPGPAQTSSLVWVETPDTAKALAGLDDTAFADALQTHLRGLLGGVAKFTPRRVFPLSGQTAERLAANRTALVGEAGHVIPPIGAQGLNLSFRDAATFAEAARDSKIANGDAGADTMIERYHRERYRDVTSRVSTVDLLNRSLLSEWTPVQFARGFGLFALSTIGPLRRFVMREGVRPQFSTPELMRPGRSSHLAAGGPLDSSVPS